MPDPENASVIGGIAKFVRNLLGKQDQTEPEPERTPDIPCCSELVHIGYRGVSDDRMYMAYNRKWSEVPFFKPNGLRVFCAVCRHRVL